ncbi:PhnD/SsuA/transferrin family substrate-binding protein [Pseudomonas sp. CCI3.2]|uniref:phosphate/phosphite/phosphonate ABC transporter substrate-binding protein n=1 Tax=unclassified Pseudomonas TaxID=196821 RepID=UPI002AC8C3AF|nr:MULTISPECIES: PhnD/SsuA/transferrin family substrate-binding protein [unclassified Pseudomonas]MEB0075796.1 PhnD/SsuA/transferrin family substrate-binding protein [Pseudomonas sp. MH10out]MEB0091735.1 PhnD/SsuA/transferrin family substrate-binding protein [Pseudomonas sp. CCI4.2]MEB0099727.1 PhnD/SsuA/transferrin family substrate-binding protein [Pseudomonas sp. CCI3.2]MEB0131550.1 PhnD/SsuA/transferrin family substrate-binding protein [Pseudomonas sp. CCI2.4]MEB0156443.1 PhnD/SsuA/transfer
MTHGFAALLMYTAPDRLREANEAWLTRTLQRLGITRDEADHPTLMPLWLSSNLLLTQTCGYPLMTSLRGKVRLIGRPDYRLAHSANGGHCSLLLVRDDDSRTELEQFRGSHGLINNEDSNSGMNLLRHRLAPLQRDGRFFSAVSLTGGHRESLRWLREKRGDLAAIDSVTYDYLARDASAELNGLRILARSAISPTLPYIGAVSLSAADAERIRDAMNLALQDLPEVAATLAIHSVLPTTEEDYQVLLGYQREAQVLGFAVLN